MEKVLHRGAVEKIEMVLTERIKRLKDVAHKMPRSIELNEKAMKEHAIQKTAQEGILYTVVHDRGVFDRLPQ